LGHCWRLLAWAILAAFLHWKAAKTGQQQSSASTNVPAIHRTKASEGISASGSLGIVVSRKQGATEFRHTTNGAFHNDIVLGCHPAQIRLDFPISRDVATQDLPIEIPVGRNSIALVRFTNSGIEINERGTRGIELRGLLVRAEPVTSVS
jgi:hypothetical protein